MRGFFTNSLQIQGFSMLITTQTGFLRAIQQAAGNGYWHYTQGTIHCNEVLGFVSQKKAYNPNQAPQQAWRDGKRGKARAKLFMYPNGLDTLVWVLMATDGAGDVRNECIKDLRLKRDRVTIGSYKLIQKPTKGGKQSFTWGLTQVATEYHIDTLKQAVRTKQDFKIRQKIADIEALSSFSGVREVRKRLQSVLKTESRRVFGDTLTQPYLLKNLFVRAVKIDSVVNLGHFVSEMYEKNRDLYEQLASYRRNKKRRGTSKPKPIELPQAAEPVESIPKVDEQPKGWIKKLFS